MEKNWTDELETPCIVIDKKKTVENIKKMQMALDGCQCKLRPHIKTHKMPFFAKLQLQYGASGITCAKVSEAEVMAAGGLDDIFIAYPMVGDFRVRRAIALTRRIKRLILAVDSLECAQALQNSAMKESVVLEVRLEVDTGARRTGVLRHEAAVLAKKISLMKNLRLTGIYTFKSLVYHDNPTTDKEIAGEEEGKIMQKIAEAIRAEGIEITDVSAGSTPTGIVVARTGLVNEVRPGTYIFNDYMVCQEGAATIEDISVRLYATVVSVPCKEYAVIDGGTKTFPMDITLDTDPYQYPGYAIVEGKEDLRLRRMNEEHGIITSLSGDTKLKVGQKIALIPIHVCTAINLQNQVYLYDDGKIEQMAVGARGMLV